MSQRPLSLIVQGGLNRIETKKENMDTIEKFNRLEVIEKFELVTCD